jgi:DNA polymerase III epsilon subunit-like protein
MKLKDDPVYLIFDTETTGLPINWKAPVTDLNNWPRIVQIAWLQYDFLQQEVSSHNYIIKPQGFTIPDDAVKIHGISDEIANTEGVELRTVMKKFSKAIELSRYMIAHNISFDENVVGAEFLREDIKHRLFEKNRICTKELSTDFCKIPGNYGNYKWPSLAELYYILFNEDFEDTHNAVADVAACARCFFALISKRVIPGVQGCK